MIGGLVGIVGVGYGNQHGRSEMHILVLGAHF